MNSPRTVLNERDTRRGGGEGKPGIPLNCRNQVLLNLLALTAARARWLLDPDLVTSLCVTGVTVPDLFNAVHVTLGNTQCNPW